jgi:hypothetical protein
VDYVISICFSILVSRTETKVQKPCQAKPTCAVLAFSLQSQTKSSRWMALSQNYRQLCAQIAPHKRHMAAA